MGQHPRPASCYFWRRALALLAVACGPAAQAGPVATPGAPVALSTDLLTAPMRTTLTDPRPTFGWVVNDARQDAVQSGYRIIVSHSREGLVSNSGYSWDSGKVTSGDSTNRAYAGEALASDATYFWTVRTWDQAGLPGPWAEPQQFRTGTLVPGLPFAASTRDNTDFSNRYPLETEIVRPVRVAQYGKGHWFVDFGRDVFGTLAFRVPGDAPGTVEIRLGEVLDHTGEALNPSPGGTRRYLSVTQALTPGARTYQLALPTITVSTRAHAIAMPPHVGEVMPFRYCELLGYPGILTPDQVWQIAVHSHFDDGAASFHSSDETLNRVWDLCHDTMKATSFLGIYVDGDRERRPYEADAYINQLGHYASDREFTLARHSFAYLMANPTWPAEWQPHMVFMAWEDYLATGDDRLLRAYYDGLAAKTLQGLARPDGLIQTANQSPEFLQSIGLSQDQVTTIVDWPVGERDGHQVTAVDAVTNAFHYRSLVLMARIAAALDRPEDEARWRRQAAQVQAAYQTVFFDPAAGLYRDGEGVAHSSLHANLFPLAFGLVPRERQPAVIRFITSRGLACSVYGAQYLIDGLYRAGADQAALALLTGTGPRSWQHMLDAGSTLTTEAWDNAFKPNQDWNHAWGAAPANLIARDLMGIRPVEPAYAKFLVEPRLGSLSAASITVPTIRGTILAVVTQQDGAWSLVLRVPANTSAVISVPTGDPDAVTESRRPIIANPLITPSGVDQGRSLFEVPAGTYHFSTPLPPART